MIYIKRKECDFLDYSDIQHTICDSVFVEYKFSPHGLIGRFIGL